MGVVFLSEQCSVEKPSSFFYFFRSVSLALEVVSYGFFNDQVRAYAGSAEFAYRPSKPAGVCPPIFAQTLHPAPTIFYLGITSVFQDRLPGHRRLTERVGGVALDVRLEAGAQLFDAMLRRAAALHPAGV